MEEKKHDVVTEEVTTEKADTQTAEEKEAKTFTQEEVNSMIETRLKKERKNLPTNEELDAFNKWKEEQKTSEEKAIELQKKYDAIDNDNASLKRTNQILGKFVDKETMEKADYINYKLSHLEGDFEDNLNKYFEENPIKTEEPKKTTGFSQNVANNQVSEEKAYLDKKYANNPYYKK